MEIEAKYGVEDAGLFASLRSLSSLGGYGLSPEERIWLADTYLDTPDWALRRAGYACRVRKSQGGMQITVKGLDQRTEAASPSVHRREELEVELGHGASYARATDAQAWPESAVRGLVLEIIGERKLTAWFRLLQTRYVRKVYRGGRAVAELCLDETRIAGDPEQRTMRGLELELLSSVPEAELMVMAMELPGSPALRPEPESKFERALKILGLTGAASCCP